MMTGVSLVHVPYRGSAPMVIDLLSGQVQVAFDVLTTSLPHIRSGAIADKTRFDQLPDVPTIDDAVPGYEASVWAGVGVPRGTPGEIIERLNREINAGLVNRQSRRGWRKSPLHQKFSLPPSSALMWQPRLRSGVG
jgi:tripartite-type tricarboxylate transporter receptor subunit TctC